MSRMIELSKGQAKALYAAIELHCKSEGHSPYTFGYTAGVSHNYVYRLKDARSVSYRRIAIKKIIKALGGNYLEDVIGPKVNLQQKDKPKIEVQADGASHADKFDALQESDKDVVRSLVSVLHERTVLHNRFKERIETVLDKIIVS